MTLARVKYGPVIAAIAFAVGAGWSGRVQAQTISVSVDATVAGTPLERVWPYHGYDEVNYSTSAEGEALLKTLATAHTAPAHVRSHFLLNTGNGVGSLKWGSTNVYTEDAAGNPVYSWTIMDGIMDAVTGAGVFPIRGGWVHARGAINPSDSLPELGGNRLGRWLLLPPRTTPSGAI